MRIAIPIFGCNVSPRVDCASQILMVDVEDGSIAQRWVESTEPFRWQNRMHSFKQKGVDVMLCGGIRRCDYRSLSRAGIVVHAGLVGEVEDVLEAFLGGKIQVTNPDEFFRGNFARRGRARRHR